MRKLLTATLVILGVAVSTLGFSQVYKWKDANGNTAYGDKVPTDARDVERVRVPGTRGVKAAGPYPVATAVVPAAGATQNTSPPFTGGDDPSNSAPSQSSSSGSTAVGGGGGGGGAGGAGLAKGAAGQGGAAGSSGSRQAAAGQGQPSSASPMVAAQETAPAAPTPPPPPRYVINLADLSFPGPQIGPITKRYFGMHIHRALKLPTWPQIGFGSWNLWDADNVTWVRLEPLRGQWHFEVLDQLVDLAQQNDVELMYTLALTPPWASARPDEWCPYGRGCAAEPANMADWENFVRTVATRYRGRIKYWEVWNEPSLSELEKVPKAYWSGSAAKLLELQESAYRVLKQVDSNNMILSPGFVGDGQRLDYYFGQLNGRAKAVTDIVSSHFYTQDPEQLYRHVTWIKSITARRGIADKPLWNSETGYTVIEAPAKMSSVVVGMPMAAAYVSRDLVLGAAVGIERFQWYALDSAPMGLLEARTANADLRGIAYATTVRWLKGAMLDGCVSADKVKWVCQLSRGTRKAWIVWAAQGDADFTTPSDAPAVEYETLTGQTVTLPSAGGPVPINFSPVLVKLDSGRWAE